MAAYASPRNSGSSTLTSVSSSRGSWGDARDGRPPSSSGSHAGAGRVFPHIDDLVRDAQPRLPPDTPPNQSLLEAEQSFKSSKNSLDFGRPDTAFKEYMKAYEIAINLIPRHKDYGFWASDHQKSWLARYKALYNALVQVEDQMKGVRQVIKDNNIRHGTRPSTSDRRSVNGNGYADVPVENGLHSQTQHPPRTSSHAAASNLPNALRAGAPRPVSRPKPEGLQGRPLSGGNSDLSERFAKLRSAGNASEEATALTMPKASDYKYGSQTSPTTNGVRPGGPRPMVNGANGPSLPPKLPISTSVGMPKPPSPTYSPINPSMAGLQPGWKAPPESRPPSDKRQLYYNQPQHGSTASLSARTRDEILLPYRPTTPNGVNNAIVPKSQSRDIPHNPMMDPQTLQQYMTKYNVLLVDIRDRTSFDEGHIMASSVICIEPISLREGLSAEDLEDGLVLSPDLEQTSFSRRNEFDVVVYYDQHTDDVAYLRGPPTMTNAPALRAFYDTLYEFNDTKPLKDGRPPALLRGGLDAWVDLLGIHSLASSRTAAMLGSTRQRLAAHPGRPVARQRMVSSNTRFEVRNRRLRGHSFLDEKEQQEWQRKAQQEEVEPTPQAEMGEGDYVVVEEEAEPTSPFVSDVDSFLRRFPSVADRQSMTMPTRRPVGAAPRREPPPLPSIPSRPPPAAPRPSYSGQADINQSQASLARVTSSTRAPLYSSASLARTRKLPRTGLTNFGVTCYMNSTLQCLSATIPLSQFFTDRMYEGYVQKNWKGSSGIMPKFYANLIQALWNDDCEGIKPSSFRNFCGRMNREWVIDRQQDAKEFFDFLVDCLHEDLNMNWERTQLRPLTTPEEQQRERMQIVQASPIEWQRYEHRDRSYVSSLFAGQHASRLRCLTCGNTSTTYEAFYSISIEIPRSGQASIYDCLRSYCKEEKLSQLWKCPHCKCEREATKQIILTRLPQFLVIHFKRFAASKFERAKKIHTAIDFPLLGFNMDDFVIARQSAVPDQEGKIDLATTPPYRYDAYGVLKHLGHTLEEGHYISTVKDPGRGVWREFNDERHRDFDPAKVNASKDLQDGKAYIVFYQRAAVR